MFGDLNKFSVLAYCLQRTSWFLATLWVFTKIQKPFFCLNLTRNYCCAASVASEQQHKQDLRRTYKREYEFSKSSLFTRMLCGFLPECIAPSTRVHCAMNNTRLWHCCNGVLFLRGLQLRQVSGYGLLWFTCKAMWARSCLAFTTLAVVVNAEYLDD